MIIIGGAAIGFAYVSDRLTKDIDLWPPDATAMKPFWEAVRRVEEKTGKKIPISPSGVAEAPEGFENRLYVYELRGAKNLTIFLPERHDLAMMKTARGETPDIEAIIDIHKSEPLDPDVLIARYLSMEPDIIGRKSSFRLNFLAMIDAVFGQDVAEEVKAKLPAVKDTIPFLR